MYYHDEQNYFYKRYLILIHLRLITITYKSKLIHDYNTKFKKIIHKTIFKLTVSVCKWCKSCNVIVKFFWCFILQYRHSLNEFTEYFNAIFFRKRNTEYSVGSLSKRDEREGETSLSSDRLVVYYYLCYLTHYQHPIAATSNDTLCFSTYNTCITHFLLLIFFNISTTSECKFFISYIWKML